MKTFIVAACLFVALSSAHAEPKTVTVGLSEFPPFSSMQDGHWVGIDVDLANRALSQVGLQPQFVAYDTVDQIVSAVRTGALDMAMSGITITDARRRSVDFSTPYFDSGLRLLVRKDSLRLTFSDKIGLFCRVLKFYAVVLLAVVAVFAFLFWLAEMSRKDPNGMHPSPKGLFNACYWAATTLSTTGYGDVTPKRIAGRLIAILCMVFGIITYATIAGSFSAALTELVKTKQSCTLSDMSGKRFAAEAGTTSQSYLSARGIPHQRIAGVSNLVAALESDEVDAVLIDAPVASWLEKSHPTLAAGGDLLDPQRYAVVLPKGSPISEPLEVAMLAMFEDGRWQKILDDWLK